MFLIDGVRGALTEAGVGDETVQQILEMLEEGREMVRRSERLERVPATSLGRSATATELQFHAAKAHTHVVEAMTQMVAGMQGYHDSVQHFRKVVHETDSDVRSDFTRRTAVAASIVAPSLRLAASCTQQKTFHGDSSCEAPGEGEG